MSNTQKKETAVIDYQLTEAERRIVAWVRNNSHNGIDWVGTIRFVSGANVFQMSNHTKAGQVRR
jgi:hypothetical protein